MQSGMVLLFVYNIERGNLSGMTDYRQSLASAKTPRCNLFALIFTPVGMKKTWKRFINDLGFPANFYSVTNFNRYPGNKNHLCPLYTFIQESPIMRLSILMRLTVSVQLIFSSDL